MPADQVETTRYDQNSLVIEVEPAAEPAAPEATPASPAPAAAGLTEAWTTVVEDVRTLTVDLAEVGFEVARQIPRPSIQVPAIPRPELTLPALPQLHDGWSRAQDALAREVKNRLDQVTEPPRHPHATRAPDWRSPAELLDDLLTAGATPDPEAGRAELYRALLLRLVPDEACILALLAEGHVFPLVHVQTKSRTVLANASTVDQLVRLAVPEAAGTYLANLVTLGLAEEGQEDEALAGRYEQLAADPRVRAAEELAREDGRLGSRLVRRTLVISPLGRSLWTACRQPSAAGQAA